MKNIFAIVKKELSRVFKDKKLVFTTIIMPGLMIFLMYTLMGDAIQKVTAEKSDEYNIAICNSPVVSLGNPLETTDLFKENFKVLSDTQEYNVNIKDINVSEVDTYKQMVKDESWDLVVYFEDNFFANVIGDSTSGNCQIVYNPNTQASNNMYTIAVQSVQSIERTAIAALSGKTNFINLDIVTNYNEQKAISTFIAMMLPFLIITFLFSGAMSVAPESIAGDKERGTMATLLVTPIKRNEIAFGKIIGLSIIAVTSAVSSFVGIIASLPKLMNYNESININDIYGFKDYALVFVILISTVLFIIGIISCISGLAKNLKEATTYILPLYFVSMALGIATMNTTSAKAEYFWYFIPLYNSLEVLVSIFSFSIDINNFLITVASNFVYTCIFVFLLSRIFNNEKLMFSK